MKITFSGEMWFWRGPSPFHFISVPEPQSAKIREIATHVSYGWGVIPAEVTIGETSWSTSLIPKDGLYLVPLKNAIRFGEKIELGDVVLAAIDIEIR
jgi:hypothetical protein